MTKIEQEIWKPVKGYEGIYEVSSNGGVRCISRNGKPITPYVLTQHDFRGYRILTLYRNAHPETKRVHRLVAEAFIPNPRNAPQVNHIDGNKSNNFVPNLEWVSAKENIAHAIRTGLTKPIDEYPGTVLHSDKMHEVVGLRRLGLSCAEIGEIYGVGHATVSLRIARKTYLRYYSERDFEAKVADFIEKNKWKYKRRDGRVFDRGSYPTKPILQLGKGGEVVCRFDSIAAAAKANNVFPSAISNNLIGRSKTCNGYKYVYE